MTQKIGEFDLLAFDDDRPCPKCGGHGAVDRYAWVSHYVRGGHGEFLDVSGAGGMLVEHLIIRCLSCGWCWLKEPLTKSEQPQ